MASVARVSETRLLLPTLCHQIVQKAEGGELEGLEEALDADCVRIDHFLASPLIVVVVVVTSASRVPIPSLHLDVIEVGKGWVPIQTHLQISIHLAGDQDSDATAAMATE